MLTNLVSESYKKDSNLQLKLLLYLWNFQTDITIKLCG